MAVREYYNRDDQCLSRELFDANGFITEWIRFGADGREQDHWHFERGTPIRQIRKGTEYVKRGDRFGYFQDGKFIDTPRASLSR
jgi:hypothetical protein